MPNEKQWRKSLLFSVVFMTSFTYILWRLLFTLPTRWGTVSLVFGIILWVCEAATVLETFTHFLNARNVRIPEMPRIRDDMYPDVDVLIATHNEDEALLFKTLNGCKHMKYPDKRKVHIYLCDDGNRPEMRALCERMEVGYFGFSGNKYAKAGNINNALPQTHSPLIAIFDADMIPTSDFLLETVPYFFRREMIKDNGVWRMRRERDPKSDEKPLGYVQTQQSFYNPDPLQRNLYKEDTAPNEQDYFYRSVNVSRMASGSAAFAGSNAVFARQALEDIGGFEVHSITEDFVTGISILGKGYTSYALPKELAHGLSPEDVYSFIKQRQRWSRGAAQGIMSRKFWHSGLSLKAKWNFLVSYFYWWTFVRRFVFILCPILYGIFGIHVADVTFLQLIAVWFPYYIIYNIGLRNMSGGTTSALWSDTVDTIQFPYMMWPIIAGTLTIPQRKFFVTPKGRQEGRNSHISLAIPHIILALLSVFTIVVCIRDIVVDQNQGSIVVLFWACYNLYAIFNAIIYYLGRSNNRQTERMPIHVPVTIHTGIATLEGLSADLSEGGMAVVLPVPDYVPIEGSTVSISFKDYRTAMPVEVVQVQQLLNGKWKYSLKLVNASEKDFEEYLQILYDRNHFFPRTIDMGIVKDMRNVFRGITAKAKQGERRLPRINMYAKLHSPEAGTVYAVNFNYRYVLLHAGRSLPDTLRLDFTDAIQITCIKNAAGSARQTNTELYEIENWEQLLQRPDYRARVLELAAEAANAEETAEMAEISERKREERAARKRRNRRRIRVVFTIAAFAALYIALLPNAAKEFEQQTGISANTVKALYQEASSYIGQGDWGEAVRALMDIRGYKDTEQQYEDTVDNYRLQVLGDAQDLNIAGEYPQALVLLREALATLRQDQMIESKISSIESRYIQTSFRQADEYVAADAYEEALDVLRALQAGLGREEASIGEKVEQVYTAYRDHYIALAQAAFEQRDFSGALALLAEALERTGASETLEAKQAEITRAYKDDFLERARIEEEAMRFGQAIAILLEAEAVFPEDAVFPQRLLEVRVAEACALADAQAEQGDFAGALATIAEAMDALGEQRELRAQKAKTEAAYAADSISRAESLLKTLAYDEAIALLAHTLGDIPQSNEVAQKLAEAQQAQMTYAFFLELFTLWRTPQLPEIRDIL